MTQAIAQPTNQTTLLMDLVEELSECETLDSLNEIKTGYEDKLIKEAWGLLSKEIKEKIHRICDPHSPKMNAVKTETKPELKVIKQVEEPATYTVPEVKSKTLIELSSELDSLDSMIESANELDAETATQLESAINELFSQHKEISDLFLDKIDNYLAMIKSRQAYIDMRKAEAERLRKLAESDQKTVDFLSERLKRVLEQREITKLRTKRYNLTVAKNGGKQPVWIDGNVDPVKLDQRFQKVVVDIDKTAIRNALEAGEELEFAQFEERKTHLRIK